jgi:TolA-binding protein
MAKKIKREKVLTEAEQKAEDQKKEEEAQRTAAGIQDDFQARGFELVEWMHERQSLVLGIIAVIVGGGLAFGVYNWAMAGRNAEASKAFVAALETWEAPVGEAASEPTATGPKFKDAKERDMAAKAQFEAAAQGHSGGVSAIAKLYAGHAAARVQDWDAAAKAYQGFLDAVPAGDTLRFAGFAGLADALEAKGDVKGAIAALEQHVNLADQIDEDAALLTLGRLYQKEGNTEAAKKSLQRVSKDFPESTLKSKAEELLLAIGGTVPEATGGAEFAAP